VVVGVADVIDFNADGRADTGICELAGRVASEDAATEFAPAAREWCCAPRGVEVAHPGSVGL
jgi:hypothetical protein